MSQLYLAPYIAPEFLLTHEQVGLLASALAITWHCPLSSLALFPTASGGA